MLGRPGTTGWVLLVLLLWAGCGYRLAGQGSFLPPEIRRIAVPPFGNETAHPEVAQRITEALADAFLSRGGYTTVSRPEEGDAVLSGTVASYRTEPVALGPDGRATRYEIQVEIRAEMRDRRRNASLWKDDHFVFRQQYDVSGSEAAYFDQSIEAVERMSRDLARTVVASILEGF